jgi:hypothetical protein
MIQPRSRPRDAQLQSLPSPSNPLIPSPEFRMVFDDWVDDTVVNGSRLSTRGPLNVQIWEECFEDVCLAPVTDDDIEDGCSSDDGHDTAGETKGDDWEMLAQPFWVNTRTHVEIYTRPTGGESVVVPESGVWEEGRDFCGMFVTCIHLFSLLEISIVPRFDVILINQLKIDDRNG